MIRPTGLVDPKVVVKPTRGQIDDLIGRSANAPRPTSGCW
ncbi:uvrABC system B domain protein [Mycobacterium xenopi 3993]|nr:uvrABC system B domain protein [Mycobacterium xenopi 3993]